MLLLHQLYVFTKVSEEKSFSKAAESIYLSQSTVSSHINNLEKYFGQKLFDRLGKEVALTYFGEKLYPWAKEILQLKDKALLELKDYKIKIEGHIKITASTVPAHYIVPGLLSRFSSEYPDIKYSLNMSNSREAAEMLAKGKTDLSFTGLKHLTDKLEFIPLAQEKLVAITPPSLRPAAKVSIKELAGYPFLFRKHGSGTQAILEEMLQKAGIDITKLKVIGYFNSVEVIKQCVKEGMGISIISEIAASDYVRQNLVNACEIDELKEKRTFYLAYNKKRTLPPIVDLFIKSCSNYKYVK